MKTTIFSLLGLFAIVFSVSAQAPKPPIGVGPLLTLGAAVNAGNVLTGYKTAPQFSYALGATSDIPLTPSIAFDFGIVYDARSINFHDQSNENVKIDYTFSYLGFRPAFRFSSFVVGVELGIPFTASSERAGQIGGPALNASSMNTLIELQLGATIPLVELDRGKLNFLINGTYGFTRINSDAYQTSVGLVKDRNNGPLASLEIGVNYLFNIGNH
jgi:hypothetical protein